MLNNPYMRALKSPGTIIDRNTREPFNPKAFDVKDGKRRYSAKEDTFTDDGELNADNKREVFGRMKDILDGVADGTFQISREASAKAASFDDVETQVFVRQAFSDPTSEGFKQVGQALLNPIKEVIDYEGVTRKLWAPRTVKQGEVIRYDKDAWVVAHVVAEDGETPQSVVDGTYFYPPEFPVSAYPSISIGDQARAQYDILARMQDRARQSIEWTEDTAGVTLLQSAGTVKNALTQFATFNLAAIEALCYQIERHRLITSAILIHRQELGDLRNSLTPLTVDPVTKRELFMAGFLGSIYNALIITTAGTNPYNFSILTPGDCVAVAPPEYLGGMAIRVELISEPTTEAVLGKARRGWFWYEIIALALINAAGVALGHKI